MGMSKCEFCGSSIERLPQLLGYPDMSEVSQLLGDVGSSWSQTEASFPGFAKVSRDYQSNWRVCDTCYDRAARILLRAGRRPEFPFRES